VEPGPIRDCARTPDIERCAGPAVVGLIRPVTVTDDRHDRYDVGVAESSAQRPERLTKRDATTRARIVETASHLMYRKGVTATTLDDVREQSGTSKSQLYRHFPDKDALVQAVIGLRSAEIMAREEERLQELDSFRGLELWRDALVRNNELQNGAYGCALGSMANELSDSNDEARVLLDETLRQWERLLVDGFERMRTSGVLRDDVDPQKLAVGMMAALQGGYLLAQAARDATPMAVALDMAIEHVKSLAA
jgi:TetR/AcrR family transcriptional regulator, transcriptional repressor for nem operon